MNCTRILGGFVALAMLTATAMAADPIPEKHQGLGRIYDKDAGLSIVPPTGWTPVKSTDAAFMTFKQAQSDGIANINVRWVKYTGTPLTQIADALKTGMPKKFKDWRCESEGTPTIDNKTCYSILSRYTTQLNGQPVELLSLQYLIPTNKGRAYIITCSAAPKSFEGLQRSFEIASATSRVD